MLFSFQVHDELHHFLLAVQPLRGSDVGAREFLRAPKDVSVALEWQLMDCEFAVGFGFGVIGEVCEGSLADAAVVGLAFGASEAAVLVLVQEEGVDAGSLQLLLQVSRVH